MINATLSVTISTDMTPQIQRRHVEHSGDGAIPPSVCGMVTGVHTELGPPAPRIVEAGHRPGPGPAMTPLLTMEGTTVRAATDRPGIATHSAVLLMQSGVAGAHTPHALTVPTVVVGASRLAPSAALGLPVEEARTAQDPLLLRLDPAGSAHAALATTTAVTVATCHLGRSAGMEREIVITMETVPLASVEAITAALMAFQGPTLAGGMIAASRSSWIIFNVKCYLK